MAAQPLADTPTPDIPDNRRITEHDPAVVALKAKTARKLQASVNRLIRDLRPGSGVPQGEAQSQFIHRHVDILRAAYVEAHRLGQRQYYDGVSRDAAKWAREEPDPARMARTLAFYAPSVAKIAHEAAVYAAAAHTHRALTRMAALAEVETMFGPPVSELPEPQEDGQYSLDELDELRRLDALPEFAVDEDGADEDSYKLFNPNHDARGRFAPGSGGGGSHGAAQHAGGGHIGAHVGAGRGEGAYGGLGFAHQGSGAGGGAGGAGGAGARNRVGHTPEESKRLQRERFARARAKTEAQRRAFMRQGLQSNGAAHRTFSGWNTAYAAARRAGDTASMKALARRNPDFFARYSANRASQKKSALRRGAVGVPHGSGTRRDELGIPHTLIPRGAAREQLREWARAGLSIHVYYRMGTGLAKGRWMLRVGGRHEMPLHSYLARYARAARVSRRTKYRAARAQRIAGKGGA